MIEILRFLLTRSLAMIPIVALFLIASKCVKNISNRTWYRAGLVVLVGFILPLRFSISLPEPVSQVVDQFTPNLSAPLTDSIEKQLSSGYQLIFYEPITQHPFSLFQLVVAVWVCIALLILIKECYRYGRLLCYVKRWGKEQESDLLRNYPRADMVTLRYCSKAASAFSYGYLHPTIVLPEGYNMKENDLMIHHELIHLSHYDPYTRLLTLLITCFFWFHPLVWMLRKRLNQFAECACDEELSQELPEAERFSYADLLLNNIRQVNKNRSGLVLYAFPSKKTVMQRLLVISHTGMFKQGQLVLCLACFLIVLSGCTKAAEEITDSLFLQPLREAKAYDYNMNTNDEKLMIYDNTNNIFDGTILNDYDEYYYSMKLQDFIDHRNENMLEIYMYNNPYSPSSGSYSVSRLQPDQHDISPMVHIEGEGDYYRHFSVQFIFFDPANITVKEACEESQKIGIVMKEAVQKQVTNLDELEAITLGDLTDIVRNFLAEHPSDLIEKVRVQSSSVGFGWGAARKSTRQSYDKPIDIVKNDFPGSYVQLDLSMEELRTKSYEEIYRLANIQEDTNLLIETTDHAYARILKEDYIQLTDFIRYDRLYFCVGLRYCDKEAVNTVTAQSDYQTRIESILALYASQQETIIKTPHTQVEPMAKEIREKLNEEFGLDNTYWVITIAAVTDY